MTRPRRAGAGAWGLALVLFLIVFSAASPSGADSGEEAALLGQVAAARAGRRLAPLGRAGGLDTVARRHAARMAAAPSPFHNGGLRAETAEWTAVGEVVGRITAGPGWEGRLLQLFLASPAHRQVLLANAYTAVGVGTARGPGDEVNAVLVLARDPATRPAAAPRPARGQASPRPSPPPTAPTTAAPPPPTTTTVAPSPASLAPVPAAPAPAPLVALAAHRRAASAPLRLAGSVGLVMTAAGAWISAMRSRPAARRRPWR